MRSTGPTSDPPQIGRYQVIRHLATGGMAQIYLARMDGMASFERHVVLKTILANRANDRRFINMFLDEAKLAATLNHQNIAQVYEVDQADGAYYMAMEFVHGENCRAILETSIRRATVIPVELAVLIVSGAAAGLHHAHERKGKSGQALNIVHRDVSPANIMVGYDGSVKVLDFGIAKAEERYTQTVGSTIKGKYGYMSPEQCKGKAIDRRSDIFALGIVLYELTTQRRAFKGRDDFDTMKRIVAGDLVLPSSLVPGYPPELEGIILKALASEPEDRYSTAQEMIEALDVFAQRAKLACTNTAMARFMVHLFGEPREPWETSQVDARRPAASSPAINSPSSHGSMSGLHALHVTAGAHPQGHGQEQGHDEAPTTVLGGGDDLTPVGTPVQPRTITTPLHGRSSDGPTGSGAIRGHSTTGVSGRMAVPAVGSVPPPARTGTSTTPPPMRAAGATTPPPVLTPGYGSDDEDDLRAARRAAPTTPPPLRRMQRPTGATTPMTAPRPQPPSVAAASLPASGPIQLPSATSPGSDSWSGRSDGRADGRQEAAELYPEMQSGPMDAAAPVVSRTVTPAVAVAPMFAAGKAPTPSQLQAARVATPLMRPTPGPLSVPLVPRTYTPAALPPPPLGPLLQQRANSIGNDVGGATGSNAILRASSEDGGGRAHSSVMAPFPLADSSTMAPLPRPETLAPDGGEQRFKYRWAIVVVLLVVLAAVGLMIMIALTSS